jgi:hypothetical protein
LFSREFGRPESLLRHRILWLCYVVLGMFLPLSRVPVVARDDPGGQRLTLELTETLLEPGDRYFAGFQFLPHGDRHEHALGMVDMNSARPIQALTEAERAAITQSFRQEPIRVVIYTYKIDDEVPEHIRTHLYRGGVLSVLPALQNIFAIL